MKYADFFCENALKRVDKVSYVLKIASNDGTFLVPFKRHGNKALGVDPNENIANIPISNGIPTINNFFGTVVAEEIVQIGILCWDNIGRATLRFHLS